VKKRGQQSSTEVQGSRSARKTICKFESITPYLSHMLPPPIRIGHVSIIYNLNKKCQNSWKHLFAGGLTPCERLSQCSFRSARSILGLSRSFRSPLNKTRHLRATQVSQCILFAFVLAVYIHFPNHYELWHFNLFVGSREPETVAWWRLVVSKRGPKVCLLSRI
jgi:hypothetical protein